MELTQALPMELTLAGGISLMSLMAAGIPFYRGLRVFLRARAATRRIADEALFDEASSQSIQPIAQRMMGILRRSLADNRQEQPDFVYDATRQCILNDYDVTYAQPLSMYSNILPPIGFIGTTLGMMVLFVSLHLSNETLQLGALSVALSSTILALLGFAALETMRIRLYGRLMRCMDQVLIAEQTAQAAQAA